MAQVKDIAVSGMPVDVWEQLNAQALKERRTLKQVLIAAIEAYLTPPRKRGKT